MSDTTWVKLYRKAKNNEIMTDPTAWLVFCWVLLSVDKSTGIWKVSRSILSTLTKIPEGTIYSALKRLEKKYKVLSISSTGYYSVIRPLKWDAYQPKIKASTVRQQFVNSSSTHNKTLDIRHKNNILPLTKSSKHEVIGKETTKKRKDIQYPKQILVDVVNYYVQRKGITPQGKEWLPIQQAIKTMFMNGRTPQEIKDFIDWLSTNWSIWDIQTVAKRMPEFVAGKLDYASNKINKIKSDPIFIRLATVIQKVELNDGEFRQKMSLLEKLEQKYPSYRYKKEWVEIRKILRDVNIMSKIENPQLEKINEVKRQLLN